MNINYDADINNNLIIIASKAYLQQSPLSSLGWLGLGVAFSFFFLARLEVVASRYSLLCRFFACFGTRALGPHFPLHLLFPPYP